MQETGSPFVPDDAFRVRAEIAAAIRRQRTS
jgi:hypothetical protein